MNVIKGITTVSRRITGGVPILVPNRPERWAKEDQCFVNVKRQIDEHGGSGQCGWLFQELMGILVAVHHQVWRSPEGEAICITPQNEMLTVMGPDGIAFLEDDAATLYKPPGYEIGFRRPHIHLALKNSRRVREVVKTARQWEYEYGQEVQAMMKA